MYDPLKDEMPGLGVQYPASYWTDTASNAPMNAGPVPSVLDVDVAIIGGGYTGLSCALHLARNHNIQAHILEANQVGWGCSGRNAGFILNSTGRKPYSEMIKQWGRPITHQIFDEINQGVNSVNQLIEQIHNETNIDCEVQQKGYLKVAHKPSMVKSLVAQKNLVEKEFNYSTDILSSAEIKKHYFSSENAYGAIRFSDGYGINPLKLAWGYQSLVQTAGVCIHTSSPVIHWEQESNRVVLETPSGKVTANKVVIATNGYTPKNFHPGVDNRSLPVLSQIIVTEPLTKEQLQATNFITSNVVMDTRALKYYFRKLPDNRILFGGRGAISGKDAEDPYFANRLLKVLKKSFPPLHNIKFSYSWSGWISISFDDLPHISQADDKGNVFYSAGYCGNGVSFSVQAGKRLAEKVAGLEVPDIPFYNQQLPLFPFSRFRRIGQRGYFHYGMLKDRWF